MKPNEIIEKAKELGVSVHRNTLLNYEKWGLIPSPEFRDGRLTIYPFETYAELIASYLLKRDYGKFKPTKEGLKEIRELALKAAESGEELELIQGAATIEKELAFKWLLLKFKILDGMTVEEIKENQRAGDVLAKQLEEKFSG